MTEKSYWRRALFLSACFHLFLFVGIAFLHWFQPEPPEEELMEMSLVEDISQIKAQGGGGSGAPALPAISVPEVSAAARVPQEEIKEQSEVVPATDAPSQEYSKAVPATSQARISSGMAAPGGGAENGTGRGGSGTADGTGYGSGAGDGDGSGSSNGSGDDSASSPPTVLSRIQPSYPPSARRNNVEGIVTMSVEILENGCAGDVGLAASSGDPSLDDAAVRAVKKWRFVPAKYTKSGQAFACYRQISITFRLKDV